MPGKCLGASDGLSLQPGFPKASTQLKKKNNKPAPEELLQRYEKAHGYGRSRFLVCFNRNQQLLACILVSSPPLPGSEGVVSEA